MKYFKPTELDKTIMLAFLVFTKGSLDTYVSEEAVTSKFAMRKRKLVRISIRKLVKEKVLIRHEVENKYRLSNEGLKLASKVLAGGAKLWKI